MAIKVVKASEGVLFDPFRTIIKVGWAGGSYLWVMRFDCSAGSVAEPKAVGFGTAVGTPPHEVFMTEVAPEENAKQFFKDNPTYLGSDGPAVAKFRDGAIRWYFAATPKTIFFHNIRINYLTEGDPPNAPPITASYRLFKSAPPDSNTDDPENPYFTFEDLMTEAETEYEGTAPTTEDYRHLAIRLKDSDTGEVIDPPEVEWTTD